MPWMWWRGSTCRMRSSCGPAPGFHEAGYLRLNGGVQGHDALGSVGGAAGVDDHGGTLGVDVRQRGCGARRQDVRRQEEAQAALLGEGTQGLLEGRVGDDDGRAGVLDHVGELGLGVGGGEGDGHAAGAPDAPLGRDVVVAGRRQEGDAGLGEVRLAIEQAGGHGGGVGEELRVRERALAGDDGRAVSEALGAGYERYACQACPPVSWWAGWKYGDFTTLGRGFHACFRPSSFDKPFESLRTGSGRTGGDGPVCRAMFSTLCSCHD